MAVGADSNLLRQKDQSIPNNDDERQRVLLSVQRKAEGIEEDLRQAEGKDKARADQDASLRAAGQKAEAVAHDMRSVTGADKPGERPRVDEGPLYAAKKTAEQLEQDIRHATASDLPRAEQDDAVCAARKQAESLAHDIRAASDTTVRP